MIDLESIFGDCAKPTRKAVLIGPAGASGAAPAAVPEVSADGPSAVPIATASDGRGAIDAGGGETGSAAAVPDAALLEWIADEDVFLPPCRTCGGSDLWETILGEWRCQHCDKAALERSRSLAAKAARLRAESLPQRLAAET